MVENQINSTANATERILNMLLVEDDVLLRDMLQSYGEFISPPCAVTAVADLQTALKTTISFIDSKNPLDLVLMDLSLSPLGNEGSPEISTLIKKMHCEVGLIAPLIFLCTGFRKDELIVQEALRRGNFDGYLLKPFSVDSLDEVAASSLIKSSRRVLRDFD